MWVAPAIGEAIGLTLVGSPNFGWRSANRDLEYQVAIVADDAAVRDALGAERAALFDRGTRVQADELGAPGRRPSLVERLAARLFRSML